jgi:hypothetical protein
MRIKKIIFLLAIMILSFVVFGCGYRVMGRGGTFPDGITTLAITSSSSGVKWRS